MTFKYIKIICITLIVCRAAAFAKEEPSSRTWNKNSLTAQLNKSELELQSGEDRQSHRLLSQAQISMQKVNVAEGLAKSTLSESYVREVYRTRIEYISCCSAYVDFKAKVLHRRLRVLDGMIKRIAPIYNGMVHQASIPITDKSDVELRQSLINLKAIVYVLHALGTTSRQAKALNRTRVLLEEQQLIVDNPLQLNGNSPELRNRVGGTYVALQNTVQQYEMQQHALKTAALQITMRQIERKEELLNRNRKKEII